jgi:hypothetical protein
MPTIRVDLDTESFRRLTKMAVEERRPIPWQAEMLLMHALSAPVETHQQQASSAATLEQTRD